MFPYDPALRDRAGVQPQTIPQVLAAMQSMEDLLVDGDGLKWFNLLYLQVTEAVEARVSAGGFNDPPWLAELDVQFAALYFQALHNFLSGRPAPGSWTALFQRRNQTAVARIQFALAGVNAHINHDLPFAIAATCQITGTVPRHGTAQYRDYTGLNTTLDSLVDQAKRELNVRLLGDPMPPLSHLEDTLAAWSVAAAREKAWTNSEILWHLRHSPLGAPLEPGFRDGIDGLTTALGKTLLTPVPAANVAIVVPA